MAEKNFDSAAKTGQKPAALSLGELIAEIDVTTGVPIAGDSNKKEISNAPERTPASLQEQFIQFSLEKTLFALPLSSALEIGRRPDITPLPNLPGWVLGISNIRGEIVSFLSLKSFLGIPSSAIGGERRFLIIHNKAIKVGMVVDRIMGILSLDQIDRDLRKSPYHEGEIANYISGVAVSEKSMTNILAVDALLSSPRMTDFRGS